ncbi:hypothetical protein IC602_04270 [Virgibacillus halodenitrificans]|uniref:Spore coat protein CotO n=2 Tax=Virgibacillus halodenitrificans TaxID=1482 RepID=A0ABR7VJF9_VIRHA|nr:hypothetical protein [Virgibacillus halodenitrificans]
MMARKKFAKDPILYIHQPQVERPQAPMQHQYISPKKAKEPTSVDELAETSKNSSNSVRKKRNFFKEESKQDRNEVAKEEAVQSKEIQKDEAISEKEQTERRETDQPPVKEKTKFKDMSIEEKIQYLVNSPVHAPDLRCEVKTEKRNYRGVIKDSKDEVVIMRVGKRTNDTEIPINDILAIRMIGF